MECVPISLEHGLLPTLVFRLKSLEIGSDTFLADYEYLSFILSIGRFCSKGWTWSAVSPNGSHQAEIETLLFETRVRLQVGVDVSGLVQGDFHWTASESNKNIFLQAPATWHMIKSRHKWTFSSDSSAWGAGQESVNWNSQNGAHVRGGEGV